VAPRIAARVPVDLRRINSSDWAEASREACRRIDAACQAPAGASIVVYVPEKGWPDNPALGYLRQHGDHLGCITFEGDPFAVQQWINAYRGNTTSLGLAV